MRKSVKMSGICMLFFILVLSGVPAPAFAGIVLDIDGNGTVDGGTDGLLVNRYLYGFRGTSLISSAVGSGCTRCTATVIEAYIASLVNTYTNSLGMSFKLLPAGTFMMGSPTNELGRNDDEIQHQVTLTKFFYMQTTEVTQGQWQAVMGSNPSYFSNCGSNCPVENVSWDDVQSFITEMNKRGEGTYRLPTEAEWEYSARAGTATPFHTGTCLSADQANYDGNYPQTGCATGIYRAKTVPVAGFSSNAWGLYDMSGNVWEWCQDWYGTYPAGSVTNPVGPSTGSSRVLRGGSWVNYAWYCRSALRYGGTPSDRLINLGFRLVLSPNP